MSLQTLVVFGILTLLVCLQAICYDHSERLRLCWSRSLSKTQSARRLRPLLRVAARVLAVVAAAAYLAIVLAYVARR